jgi:hypothetical protein
VHARLKGAFYATLIFGFLALAYVIGKMLSLSAGAPHGTEVGTDIGIVALWTVGNRVFWLLFAVALVAGSEGAHYWQTLFPSTVEGHAGKPNLPWWISGTLIGLATFFLGSAAYLIASDVYTVGSAAFWAGLVASMAFGYYVAKSSNRYVWILKGAFIGSVALVPILVFYLLIRASAAEQARAEIGSLKRLTIGSPLFWVILVLTLAWACYVSKPTRPHATAPAAIGPLVGPD